MAVSLGKTKIVVDKLAIADRSGWPNDIVAVTFEQTIIYIDVVWPSEGAKIIDKLTVFGREGAIQNLCCLPDAIVFK